SSIVPRKDRDRRTADQHRRTTSANAEVLKNLLSSVVTNRWSADQHRRTAGASAEAPKNLTILQVGLTGVLRTYIEEPS
ncbi:hypothetical protein HAX54_035549, partial [Datura stramonium]|nr:hypothetical protein [Datura stramonium]